MFDWVKRDDFLNHSENDRKEFKGIRKALKRHNENVDLKHEQNVGMITGVQSQVGTLQASMDEMLKLKPDIVAGVAANHDRTWRRKATVRVLAAIISTLVVISGLVPLFLYLSSLQITIHQG